MAAEDKESFIFRCGFASTTKPRVLAALERMMTRALAFAAVATLTSCTFPKVIPQTPETESYFCLKAGPDTYISRSWNLCPSFSRKPKYLHFGGSWQLKRITNHEYFSKQLEHQDKIKNEEKTCVLPTIVQEIIEVPVGTEIKINKISRFWSFETGNQTLMSGTVPIEGVEYNFRFRDFGNDTENAIGYDVEQSFSLCNKWSGRNAL